MSGLLPGMVARLVLLGAEMSDPATDEITTPPDGDNNVQETPTPPVEVAPLAPPVAVVPPAPTGPVMDAEGNVGELTEQAKIAIGHVQQQQNNVTMQLGQNAIRQKALLEQFGALQAQAKRILDSEATRMGIPSGMPWQITPEGKARLAG